MLTFTIKYEDGPCAIDCKTIVVEARSAEAARAVVEKRNPRAMITSVEIVESVTRPAYYDAEGGSMCNGLGRSYF